MAGIRKTPPGAADPNQPSLVTKSSQIIGSWFAKSSTQGPDWSPSIVVGFTSKRIFDARNEVLGCRKRISSPKETKGKDDAMHDIAVPKSLFVFCSNALWDPETKSTWHTLEISQEEEREGGKNEQPRFKCTT